MVKAELGLGQRQNWRLGIGLGTDPNPYLLLRGLDGAARERATGDVCVRLVHLVRARARGRVRGRVRARVRIRVGFGLGLGLGLGFGPPYQ